MHDNLGLGSSAAVGKGVRIISSRDLEHDMVAVACETSGVLSTIAAIGQSRAYVCSI